MAGHSKWSNIKHTKAKNDAKKSKIFSKMNKIISVAVKEGGSDPELNPALRDAIDKAKQNNMPNNNIERTIKKASGNLDNINYEKMIYEGYGPGGSAIIIEALTENKNRTAASVRHIFDRYGGSLGTSGSVSFLFDEKGIINIDMKENNLTEDQLLEILLEKNVEDVNIEDDNCEVLVNPKELTELKDFLNEKNINFNKSSLEYIPQNKIELDENKKESFLKMIDQFEDDDDIQELHHNVSNV